MGRAGRADGSSGLRLRVAGASAGRKIYAGYLTETWSRDDSRQEARVDGSDQLLAVHVSRVARRLKPVEEAAFECNRRPCLNSRNVGVCRSPKWPRQRPRTVAELSRHRSWHNQSDLTFYTATVQLCRRAELSFGGRSGCKGGHSAAASPHWPDRSSMVQQQVWDSYHIVHLPSRPKPLRLHSPAHLRGCLLRWLMALRAWVRIACWHPRWTSSAIRGGIQGLLLLLLLHALARALIDCFPSHDGRRMQQLRSTQCRGGTGTGTGTHSGRGRASRRGGETGQSRPLAVSTRVEARGPRAVRVWTRARAQHQPANHPDTLGRPR